LETEAYPKWEPGGPYWTKRERLFVASRSFFSLGLARLNTSSLLHPGGLCRLCWCGFPGCHRFHVSCSGQRSVPRPRGFRGFFYVFSVKNYELALLWLQQFSKLLFRIGRDL